jgi:hypothetical protein
MGFPGRKRKNQVTLPAVSGWVDTTPERIRIATLDGLETEVVDHLTPSGFKDGFKHRAIQDPIDSALQRGRIDEAQHTACGLFLVHLSKAQIDGSITSNLFSGGTYGNCSRSVSHIRLENLRKVVEACKALDPDYREAWMDWCGEVLTGRAGIQRLGEIISGHHGKTRCKASDINWGFRVLKSCATDLQRYYGC